MSERTLNENTHHLTTMGWGVIFFFSVTKKQFHHCHITLTDLFFLLLPVLQIWVRNYQILEQQPANAKEAHQVKKSGHELSTSLVEIGPRFVLNPIRIFRGSFGGQTLYRNPDYISPNATRAMERKAKGMAYEERKNSQNLRKERKAQIVVPEDPLDSVFR